MQRTISSKERRSVAVARARSRAAGIAIAVALGLVAAPPVLAEPVASELELPLPLMRQSGDERLPEFVFSERDPAGKNVEKGFVEYRGAPLIVTAWASWCGVCRGEMPRLDRLAQELAPRGMRVLALSIDEGGMDVVERTLRKRGLANLRPVHDTEKMFFISIGAWGVPTTVIADAEGRIVARANGPVDWSDPSVRAFLESLRPSPTQAEATQREIPARAPALAKN